MTTFFESYKNISMKLKKRRVLRKPDFSGATQSFNQLLSAVRRTGNHQYAAFCCLALARCEQAQKKDNKEAEYLVEAGTIFWSLELENENDLRFVGFEENCSEAINCYMLAIQIHERNKRHLLCATLYYEMGTALKALGRYGQAAEYFTKAAEIVEPTSSMNAITHLNEAVECYIKQRDFVVAYDQLQRVIKIAIHAPPPIPQHGTVDLPSSSHSRTTVFLLDAPTSITMASFYSSISVESRISCILLLTLQRQFATARREVTHLAEYGDGLPMLPEAFDEPSIPSILDNFVTACERRDMSCLQSMQQELQQCFTPRQYELFLLILSQISYKFEWC